MVGLSDLSLDLIGSLLSFGHSAGFGIDTDDGLGVRLAEMYPTVGEVKLHAVYICHLDAWLARILLLHTCENCVDVNFGRKVNTLLGYLVRRIGLAKLADGERRFVGTQVGQIGKEESYAYEGIGWMTPPLPSPPMMALVSFILATTFTSPTAAALYWPPRARVTSRRARLEERLEQVLPGVC